MIFKVLDYRHRFPGKKVAVLVSSILLQKGFFLTLQDFVPILH